MAAIDKALALTFDDPAFRSDLNYLRKAEYPGLEEIHMSGAGELISQPSSMDYAEIIILGHCSSASQVLSDNQGHSVDVKTIAQIISKIINSSSYENISIRLIACCSGKGSSSENNLDSFAASLQLELNLQYDINIKITAPTTIIEVQQCTGKLLTPVSAQENYLPNPFYISTDAHNKMYMDILSRCTVIIDGNNYSAQTLYYHDRRLQFQDKGYKSERIFSITHPIESYTTKQAKLRAQFADRYRYEMHLKKTPLVECYQKRIDYIKKHFPLISESDTMKLLEYFIQTAPLPYVAIVQELISLQRKALLLQLNTIIQEINENHDEADLKNLRLKTALLMASELLSALDEFKEIIKEESDITKETKEHFKVLSGFLGLYLKKEQAMSGNHSPSQIIDAIFEEKPDLKDIVVQGQDIPAITEDLSVPEFMDCEMDRLLKKIISMNHIELNAFVKKYFTRVDNSLEKLNILLNTFSTKSGDGISEIGQTIKLVILMKLREKEMKFEMFSRRYKDIFFHSPFSEMHKSLKDTITTWSDVTDYAKKHPNSDTAKIVLKIDGLTIRSLSQHFCLS